MKIVNYGDEFTKKLSLRLSEKQFDFLIEYCKTTGITPSVFLRRVIDSYCVIHEDKY